MSDRPNTPVPDELAQVRAQIRQLEEREEALRGLLLAHPDLRTGASWLAEIKTMQTTRTDLKEMRANHPDIVEQYTFSLPVERVVLSGIDEHGEIIPARQFRKARADSQ